MFTATQRIDMVICPEVINGQYVSTVNLFIGECNDPTLCVPLDEFLEKVLSSAYDDYLHKEDIMLNNLTLEVIKKHYKRLKKHQEKLLVNLNEGE